MVSSTKVAGYRIPQALNPDMEVQKQWLFAASADESICQSLSRETGLHPLVAGILYRRGYRTPDEVGIFLQPELRQLRDPFLLRHMQEAVELVLPFLRENRRILILGDYDVDGITSTALLLSFLREAGCGQLDYFIPQRLQHGYGLTPASVDVILSRQPELVITVDNGITARKEVQQLQNEGVRVLITDHHLALPDSLPETVTVNPNHPACSYPFKKISGCGVAFKLVMALRKALRETAWWNERRPEPNLKQLLDFAALGTVADVVDLRDENRLLVHAGLQLMNNQPRPAIQALKQVKRVDGEITATTLGFKFAPLMNAAGRLYDASLAVELLLSPTLDQALPLAQQLNNMNEERRNLEQEMLTIAFEQAAQQEDQKGLVLASGQFHEGINGIVAARLAEKTFKPTILLSTTNPERYTGSGRSAIPGFHLKEALQECADQLFRFGGHAGAAGCTVAPENLEAFRTAFARVCEDWLPKQLRPQLLLDGKLPQQGPDALLVEQIQQLEPFGAANPEPLFALPTPQEKFQLLKEHHVKWILSRSTEVIGWNFAEQLQGVKPHQLAVTVGFNEFRGQRKIQMLLKEIQA